MDITNHKILRLTTLLGLTVLEIMNYGNYNTIQISLFGKNLDFHVKGDRQFYNIANTMSFQTYMVSSITSCICWGLMFGLTKLATIPKR